jgi:ribonuclease HI
MLTIYTDGSCEPNPGPGGWAFVVYEDGAEVHSASGGCEATTNNRMEMQAVLEAMRWAGDRPAKILSDSQYVVKGVTLWSAGWKRRGWKRMDGRDLVDVKNVDLWQEIDAARSSGQVFEWVRGHNGTAGNERADDLAGTARWAATPTAA